MLIAVVPAYNEGKSIGSVARGLFEHVDRVVVVDDGSSDNTAQEAGAVGAVVLRHEVNRGQGAALQTGHEYATQLGADYVLDFDADGQFDVLDIAPALEAFQSSQADILFGSRFLGKKSNLPFFKKFLILPIAKLLNCLFVGGGLSDVHNGFRLYTSKALESIHITQDRMAHATEIVAQVRCARLKYIEFPVSVRYSEYGQGVNGGLMVLKDLVVGRFMR
jgi:glycosyltransferase involved in cell wall biosynthesis